MQKVQAGHKLVSHDAREGWIEIQGGDVTVQVRVSEGDVGHYLGHQATGLGDDAEILLAQRGPGGHAVDDGAGGAHLGLDDIGTATDAGAKIDGMVGPADGSDGLLHGLELDGDRGERTPCAPLGGLLPRPDGGRSWAGVPVRVAPPCPQPPTTTLLFV